MQGKEEDNRPKPSSNRQWTTELNSTYKYIKISLPNTLLNILLWSLNESSYISLTTRQGSEEWTGARTNQRNITKINYDDLKLNKFDWIFHLLWVHCSIVHCCLCFVLPFTPDLIKLTNATLYVLNINKLLHLPRNWVGGGNGKGSYNPK